MVAMGYLRTETPSTYRESSRMTYTFSLVLSLFNPCTRSNDLSYLWNA